MCALIARLARVSLRRDDFPMLESSKLSLIASARFFSTSASNTGVYYFFHWRTYLASSAEGDAKAQVRSLPPLSAFCYEIEELRLCGCFASLNLLTVDVFVLIIRQRSVTGSLLNLKAQTAS